MRRPGLSSPLWIAGLAAAVCLGLLLPATDPAVTAAVQESGSPAGAGSLWPRLLFGFAAFAFPVAVTAFGALRSAAAGRTRRGVGAVLLLLFLLLEGSFLGLLVLRGREGEVFGLPAGVVLLLGGLWLLPLLVTSLGHGLTFDASGLAPEELARLRGSRGDAAAPSSES